MFRIGKYIVTLLIFVTTSLKAQEVLKVSSPNGKIQGEFTLQDGKLSWKVDYNSIPVILSSRLGVGRYSEDLSIKEVVTTKKDTEWHPVWGERSTIRDSYNGAYVRIEKKNDKNGLGLNIRAYNEGIAFQYDFIEKWGGRESDEVKEDYTEFTMPENTNAWFTECAQCLYKLLPLTNWPRQNERPLTLELPNGLYASLAEAEMINYARTKFSLSPEKSNTIIARQDGRVQAMLPFSVPWRVVMIAEKPGQLLENNSILLNLNEPTPLQDVSWIKTGKIMWDMSNSMKGGKDAVDFAVKRNMQYVHFDAGWYGHEWSSKSDPRGVAADTIQYINKGDLDLPGLIQYANERGVGVWLYVNIKHLLIYLDDILPLYESWGIKGIKFGFVEVGSQLWEGWIVEAVKKCAKHHILVDIHDEFRPTGISRTYPNLLTQEGILSEMTPDATHDTQLAFTRMLAGAADFTLAYYATTGTTFTHRLCLPIVFFNPLPPLYCYDGPNCYQGEPEIEFWDKMPTTWDDTKVLGGEIGKHITVARRNKSDWFIGSITNSESRTIKIPLSFLEKDARYTAYIYSDGGSEIKTRTHVKVERKEVKFNQTLSFDLKTSGGVALRLVKK